MLNEYEWLKGYKQFLLDNGIGVTGEIIKRVNLRLSELEAKKSQAVLSEEGEHDK